MNTTIFRTTGRPFSGLAQILFIAGLAGLILVGAGSAVYQTPNQDQDEPPPKGAVEKPNVEEGGPEKIPRGIGRGRVPQAMQIGGVAGSSGGMSFSRSTVNGVTTSVLKERHQEIKLEETPDGIFLEIGRWYSRDDVEQLRPTNPELAKALEAFPSSADGASVELSVRVAQKYEAVNDEDLREEHPEAYETYLKISKIAKGGAAGFGFGIGGMQQQLQELEVPLQIHEFRPNLPPPNREEMKRAIEEMQKRMQQAAPPKGT